MFTCSIAGCGVLSGNPADHLVHRHTHRVVRGSLLVCGRPDGRLVSVPSIHSVYITSLCRSRLLNFATYLVLPRPRSLLPRLLFVWLWIRRPVFNPLGGPAWVLPLVKILQNCLFLRMGSFSPCAVHNSFARSFLILQMRSKRKGESPVLLPVLHRRMEDNTNLLLLLQSKAV